MGSDALRDSSSYLKAGDFNLDPFEDEDRDFDEDYWSQTELCCHDCEENLCFNDELILIQIVQAQNVGDAIECYIVLDDEGDFQVEPVFLHFECWDDIVEEFHNLIADDRPLPSDAPILDILHCQFCKVGIRAWEEFARVTLGELVVSERRQVTTFKETDSGSPEPACLNCINRINEDCVQIWKS